LCIIQDSREDWEYQSPRMAGYYFNSTLIISATDAPNSQKGILTRRPTIASPVLGRKLNKYLRKRILGHVELVGCPLTKRAWAAQERIMAPRVLHYLEEEMVWECQESWFSEGKRIASPIGDADLRRGEIRRFLDPRLRIDHSSLTMAKEKASKSNGGSISTQGLEYLHHGVLQKESYSRLR
jgi:hypothetical protein